MYSHMRKVKEFVKVTEADKATFEEMLGMYYAVNYPMDEERIKERLERIGSVWKVLSERKRRVLRHGVMELCKEHGRSGF